MLRVGTFNIGPGRRIGPDEAERALDVVLPHVDAVVLEESNPDTDAALTDLDGWDHDLDDRPGPGAVDVLWRDRIRLVDGGAIRTYPGGRRVEQAAGPEPAAADWLIWRRLAVDGREFVLIGCHIIASWTQPDHELRRALARETLHDGLALAAEHDDVPVAWFGDLNGQAQNPVFDVLTENGFKAIVPPEPTFGRRRIDLGFIRNPAHGPQLEVTDRLVIDLDDPFDHRAFVATLEWR